MNPPMPLPIILPDRNEALALPDLRVMFSRVGNLVPTRELTAIGQISTEPREPPPSRTHCWECPPYNPSRAPGSR
jgi:hypothetical protein